jgi:hypothetical protein
MNKPRLLLTLILACASIGFATAYKVKAINGYIILTRSSFPFTYYTRVMLLDGCEITGTGCIFTNAVGSTWQVYQFSLTYYPVHR